MILGFDFSIKSAAACLKSGDIYTFYTFARNTVIKEDTSLALRAAGVIVDTVPDEPALPKKASISQRENSSLTDAKVLIRQITRWFSHMPITTFGIEGFSFGSSGNRLAQLSGYQWVLRWELSKLTEADMMVFSPMTVKATAGKGNFKKEQMIDAFIKSEDPLLTNNGLWKALNNMPSLFQTKRGAWLKPIDDLIDAYWVLRTTERHLETLE